MYPSSNDWVLAGTWDDDDVVKRKPFVCRIGTGPPPSPAPPPMPTAPDGHTFELIKRGVECSSPDVDFGAVDSAAACAQRCAAARDCRFFIFGTGSKLGDCYGEFTMSDTCEEGWEIDDFDFYALRAPWVGCTQKFAANYNSAATADDGTCIAVNCHSNGGGGGGGGLSFIGIFDLIVLGCLLLFLAVRAGMIYREGGVPALVEMMPSKIQERIGRSRTSPSAGRGLAAADSAASSTYTTNYTAPLPVANVVGSLGDVPRSGSSC